MCVRVCVRFDSHESRGGRVYLSAGFSQKVRRRFSLNFTGLELGRVCRIFLKNKTDLKFHRWYWDKIWEEKPTAFWRSLLIPRGGAWFKCCVYSRAVNWLKKINKLVALVHLKPQYVRFPLIQRHGCVSYSWCCVQTNSADREQTLQDKLASM